jgi:hypothetical protein
MKKCKTCKVDFDEKYVNCASCRKERTDYMKSHRTPKIPKSYTKDCKLCGETFTTGNVRGSHKYKYCDNCNYNIAYRSSEKGKAAQKTWYLKNKLPTTKPIENECPTCKTVFITKKTCKGYGSYKKYCNPQCYPAKVKARELREKQRREGKDCQWCGKHISFENATDKELQFFKNKKFCGSRCIAANRMSVPKNRLAATFRSEIWKAMKSNHDKSYNWRNQYSHLEPIGFGVLGYTKEELKAKITLQFEEGMTLANYGEWHIDHIKPVSEFNFEKTSDNGFKECFALNNLQPLWAKDNLSKGSKWEEE